MRTLFVALASGVLLPSVAAAEDASTAEVAFTAKSTLFRGDEYVVVFPPEGPVRVRLVADTDASVQVDQLAESNVTWPSGELRLGWSEASRGVVELFTEVGLSGAVLVDAGGASGSIDLWEKSFSWAAEGTFDSLLLPGVETNEARAQVDPDSVLSLDWQTDLAEGVHLTVSGDVVPDAWVTVTGEKIRTKDRDVLDVEDTAELRAPGKNDGTYEISSTWSGAAAAGLAIDLVPEVEVCIDDWGCLGLDRPYHWALAQDDRSLASAPAEHAHEIPAIALEDVALDLGAVEIGEALELDLPIAALSGATVRGKVKLEGDPAFSIVGASFSATGDTVDSVTVVFAPDAEGDFRADLKVRSNDPSVPEVVIPVSGTGVLVPLDDAPVDDSDDTDLPDMGGCGCASSSPTPAHAGLLMLGLMAMAIRRRSDD